MQACRPPSLQANKKTAQCFHVVRYGHSRDQLRLFEPQVRALRERCDFVTPLLGRGGAHRYWSGPLPHRGLAGAVAAQLVLGSHRNSRCSRHLEGAAPDIGMEREARMQVTDPVCGAKFDIERTAAMVEHDGWAHFFCSAECHRLFAAHPEHYVTVRAHATASTAQHGAPNRRRA